MQKVNFLALGDSYTIGECVEAELSWPVQLTTKLQSLGIPIHYPQIIAQTGWTTRELSDGIKHSDVHYSYKLVSLQIGVNNQFQGLSLDTYRMEFHDLLSQAVSFAGGNSHRVMVLSVPDWSITPYASELEVDQTEDSVDAFNNINYEVSKGMGTRYIDVTHISRLAVIHKDFLAPDRLHPSGSMYAAWVESLLPVALAILREDL